MGFVYFLLGLLGGVLSGMGMGGGTLLIPLLTAILGIFQKQAQFLNIISFIFMSIFVVGLNIKNKFIDVFPAIFFSIPGVICSFVSAFLVKDVEENLLKILFGIFLIMLSGVQFFLLIKKYKEEKNR